MCSPVRRALLHHGNVSGSLFLVRLPSEPRRHHIPCRSNSERSGPDRVRGHAAHRRLLDHYGVDKPTISYHEHNEKERAESLVQRLRGHEHRGGFGRGHAAHLRSGISARNGRCRGRCPRRSVPGPVRDSGRLDCSGLPTDAFYFGGFVSQKQGARRKMRNRWPCWIARWSFMKRRIDS